MLETTIDKEPSKLSLKLDLGLLSRECLLGVEGRDPGLDLPVFLHLESGLG